MMPQVHISIPLSEEDAAMVESRQVMVLFVSDEQRSSMRAVMGETHEFLSLTHQNLNTLDEIAETRGSEQADLTKTIGQLRAPSRRVLQAFDVLLKFIGQAHFINPGPDGERLQCVNQW